MTNTDSVLIDSPPSSSSGWLFYHQWDTSCRPSTMLAIPLKEPEGIQFVKCAKSLRDALHDGRWRAPTAADKTVIQYDFLSNGRSPASRRLFFSHNPTRSRKHWSTRIRSSYTTTDSSAKHKNIIYTVELLQGP